MPPKYADPRAALHESDEEEEYEEIDPIEIMNEMSTVERRRVYALKGLFEGYKAVRAQFREEMAELERAHKKASERLFEIRKDIVSGKRDITAEEVARIPASTDPSAASPAEAEKPKGVQVVSPGDAEANVALQAAGASPNGGIPDFWLTAMTNTEVFDGLITERDRDALRHLVDIRCEYINNNPSEGVVMSFFFTPNEYFTDAMLTKTYNMEFNEEDGDVEIAKIEGCDIHWLSDEKNLTVITKQKKQRNKNTKQVRVVTRQEKCESFFNFFSPPKEPGEGSEEDEEDDEDFYNQEVEMDVEAGQALMEEIVPKAAHYYCGKSVEETARELQRRFGFGGDDDDDDDSDEEESEDEGDDTAGFKQMVNRRGGGPGAGGRGGRAGGAAPQQQECKQQ